MYDAVLISAHYNYSADGSAIPARGAGEYEDLSSEIPLGIIYIAQYLHDSGFNVRVVHIPHEMHALRRYGVDEDQTNISVEQILKKYPARVCGIQVHWYLYCGGAVYISDLYKKLFPDSKIFLGGYTAGALWQEFLSISAAIDGVVIGEGEKALKKILENRLASKCSNLHDVEGVAFRGGRGEFVYNPPSGQSLLPLNDIPIIHPDAPPFANIFWHKRHFINISRGLCPQRCAYCVGNNKDINPRAYQTLKVDKILEQIQVYQECGFRALFLGENHFLNTSFMQELVENIIKENFDICFELETHPVIFEKAGLLEKMIQANFLLFTMGCESGSGSVLKRMGRNSNPTQIVDSVKQIAQRGGVVLTSWISNLPGETEAEFFETQTILAQVVKAGGLVYWIENLHVLPGSQLYENPENWGIEILLTNLPDWIRWSVVSKRYVTFEEARQEPLKFLTHVNRDVSPERMIERFYSNRKLALSLIPEMKSNMESNFKTLPSDIYSTEMQTLDWYERKGWKLWLF